MNMIERLVNCDSCDDLLYYFFSFLASLRACDHCSCVGSVENYGICMGDEVRTYVDPWMRCQQTVNSTYKLAPPLHHSQLLHKNICQWPGWGARGCGFVWLWPGSPPPIVSKSRWAGNIVISCHGPCISYLLPGCIWPGNGKQDI